MNNKMGNLKITLKSDLCAASGYTYAGVIDSDVCFNENGIPYIPGRRLKGCLREAAELIGMTNIKEIFGRSGDSHTGKITVGNAYPENYELLNQELTELKESNSPFAKAVSQQNVLAQYTRIKGQTEIMRESGVAKEKSLRYIRVVNQYAPQSDTPLCLTAPISFSCKEADLRKIVKALRHIGLDRNRGLGNVICTIEDVAELPTPKVEALGSSTEYACLEYVIQNTNPLMLGGNDTQSTEHFISGQSVLGAMAQAYLRIPGTSGEDKVFQELFLKGKTLYSNLYISKKDSVNQETVFHRYIPVPLFIARLKKTEKLVNLLGKEEKPVKADYSMENGNQAKALHNRYVYFYAENEADIAEVSMDIVYHHSKKQKAQNGEDGVLYALKTIQEGQYFKGRMITERRYVPLLKELLRSCELQFGKSKSAQYGSCRVVEMEEKTNRKNYFVKAGEQLAVTLVSEGIFIEDDTYTVQYEAVKKRLAADLGIPYVENNEDKAYDSMRTAVISGYHTMWNLKKPTIPAIAAGSTFVYTVTKDCVITKEFAGEKNLEGYGEIKIYKRGDMQYKVKEHTETVRFKAPVHSRELIEAVLMNMLMDSMKEKVFTGEKFTGNPALLGRITLMLTESLNENRTDMEQAFYEFRGRIASIKRDRELEKTVTFLKAWICSGDSAENLVLDVDKMVNGNEEALPAYQKLKQFGASDLKKKIENTWGQYLIYILAYQKYAIKQEGKQDGTETNCKTVLSD